MEKLRIIGLVIVGKSNQFFTLDRLIEITGLDRISIRRALEKFSREKLVLKIDKKAGYLKVENAYPYPETKGRPPLSITYRVKDKKKLINRVAPKLKEDTAQERMWKIIRARIKFRISDLIILAEAKRENARWFVKMLRRAGIVGQTSRGQWVLYKDTGPRRPYVGEQVISNQ